MRPIPKNLRSELSKDPYYARCARQGPDCAGRITWEHALRYAGKQINDRFAILPLCWHHHLGKGLDKRLNEFLALQRASDDDLAKYPREDFKQLRKYLQNRYRKGKPLTFAELKKGFDAANKQPKHSPATFPLSPKAAKAWKKERSGDIIKTI